MNDDQIKEALSKKRMTSLKDQLKIFMSAAKDLQDRFSAAMPFKLFFEPGILISGDYFCCADHFFKDPAEVMKSFQLEDEDLDWFSFIPAVGIFCRPLDTTDLIFVNDGLENDSMIGTGYFSSYSRVVFSFIIQGKNYQAFATDADFSVDSPTWNYFISDCILFKDVIIK